MVTSKINSSLLLLRFNRLAMFFNNHCEIINYIKFSPCGYFLGNKVCSLFFR